MQNLQKKVYRVCPSCAAPVFVSDSECSTCGHSLTKKTAYLETQQILKGKIFYNGQWISIEEKLKHERFLEKQLLEGKVELNGQWISINTKNKIQKDSVAQNKNIVDFPIKPITPTNNHQITNDALEENNIVESKSLSKIIVIVFSILSFITMAVAGAGIFFDWFSY